MYITTPLRAVGALRLRLGRVPTLIVHHRDTAQSPRSRLQRQALAASDVPSYACVPAAFCVAAGPQVISYQVSGDKKWLLLVGIKKGAGGIEGQMQLYSVEKKISQPLKGHAGIFAEIKLKGSNDVSQVFVFAEKKPMQKPKLFVMEVGKARGQGFKLKPTDIPFPNEAAQDIPIAMQVSKKHDVCYMITKFGFLYLFDIHTGTALFRNRVSTGDQRPG